MGQESGSSTRTARATGASDPGVSNLRILELHLVARRQDAGHHRAPGARRSRREAERQMWSVDVATGAQTEIQTPVGSWQRLAPLIGQTARSIRSQGILRGLQPYPRSISGRTSFARRVWIPRRRAKESPRSGADSRSRGTAPGVRPPAPASRPRRRPRIGRGRCAG